MPAIAPPVSSLIVSNAKLTAELAELVTTITRKQSVGAVGELEIVLADEQLLAFRSALGAEGGTLTFGGGNYQIADREISAAAGTATIRARSALARALRSRYKVRRDQTVSPGDWIKRTAKSHGGTAQVGTSSVRGAISQGSAQSELDVLNSVCSDPDWVWAEYGGRIYAATAYYWWQAQRLKDWAVTWKQDPASDAADVTGGMTPDDTSNHGTINVTVPYEAGIRMAPLQRLILSGRSILDGAWLITDVEALMDGSSDTRVTAVRPHHPHPKAGSSSKAKR